MRSRPEDRYIALKVARTTTPLHTNIDPSQLQFVPEQVRWALAVADGMGGHAAGEVASTLTLTLALKLSQQGRSGTWTSARPKPPPSSRGCSRFLSSVDRAIAEQSREQLDLKGMGSTLTVAMVAADRLFVFHVGDSRCYLMRLDACSGSRAIRR